VPGWKSQGKSDLEIDRLYQREVALCNGVPESCSAFAGAVHADYTWLGRQVLSKSLTPAQYLMRVRDAAESFGRRCRYSFTCRKRASMGGFIPLPVEKFLYL